MKITGFLWLEEIVDKLRQKHGVDPDEAAEVFENKEDTPRFRFVEKGYREGENVYAALGRSDAGRYLIVFFVHKKDDRALVISARDMTDTERKRYGNR